MRNTILVTSLSALIGACSPEVGPERADPAPPARPAHPASSVFEGPAASSGHGGGTSGSTSGGSGWSTATPTCMFGVTGDVEAWVGDGQAWLWGGAQLQCAGTVLGVGHQFIADLGAMHGPGTYALSYASYSRSACDEQGCSLQESYAPGSDDGFGCTVDLATAPETNVLGAGVSGAFHCGKLVEEPGGARSVTVYDGSFTATIMPPPD